MPNDLAPQTTVREPLSVSDLQAIGVVRLAASMALEGGLIDPMLQDHVRQALAETSTIIEREAPHAK